MNNAYANNDKGFSLIELLVVIALMAILAAISSLSMDFIRKERLASAAKELTADIQQVRVNAMVTGQSSNVMTGAGIRFNAGTSSSYFLFNFSDANDNFAYSGAVEEIGAVTTRNLNSSLTIEIAAASPSEPTYSDPTYNVLFYNRMGLPSRFKAAGSDAGDGSIVLLLRENSLNITRCVKADINRIREGFWDAAASKCNER